MSEPEDEVVETTDDEALLETLFTLGGIAFNGGPVTPNSRLALAAVVERRGLPTSDEELVDWINDVRRAYNGLVR